MEDTREADCRNNITKIQNWDIVLRSQIQTMDKKIKDLKKLKNIKGSDHCEKCDPTATIDAIRRAEEALWTRLDELLSNLFVMSDSTHDEEVEFLKRSLRWFEREQKALSFQVDRWAKKLKKPNSGHNLELQEGYESLNITGFVQADEEKEDEEGLLLVQEYCCPRS
ncbi:hypothetical protein L484_010638 [Morus notabilis]|uniref:Uncharacterized protein n=1 Tax=Morus notabilis TaxID=981085 RepID=W9S371_9ROSA|nr:hypothetical protein L484_010638 [Morus notabilis]